MKIHETIDESGAIATTSLALEDGDLLLVTEQGRRVLPPDALEAVMKRYGAPVDPHERLADIAELAVPTGRLRHVRHLARYDVIARDYLVYESSGGQLCALATTIAGALTYLARVLSKRA